MERSTAEAHKARLRRRCADVRDRLPGDERQRLSAALAEAVVAGALAPLAARLGRPLAVCLYGAFRSEADPAPVAAWCWAHGHRVLAPRIEGAGGMSLRELGSPADWKTGRWGVPEPDAERTQPADIGGELDVVLVPGLAFDSYGGRLGYGGGYYDRLNAARLAAIAGVEAHSGDVQPRTRWVGYGFEAQKTADALPAEPHDLRLDGLATERGLIWLDGGGQVMEAGDREAVHDGLTHFNEQGRAVMVDVSDKAVTARVACAETRVRMRPETLRRIVERSVAKGDVLAIAQVAGIQAAKRTADWIPLCHPLPLTGVDIRFADNGFDTLIIEAEVKTTGKTGVEMEALTAVSAAALTVYDMCKALQKDMEIGPTLLLAKTGGKSGDYARRQQTAGGGEAADAD